jgi:hypothetical protein
MASSSSSPKGEPMPRLRLGIHPTGHIEVEVEGMTDDGCHALVDEAASRVGLIVQRRPRPPAPYGAAVERSTPYRVDRACVRISGEPSAK